MLKYRRQDNLKRDRGSIPGGQPHDLWRRTLPAHQIHEPDILGDYSDRRANSANCLANLVILRFPKSDLVKGFDHNAEPAAKPWRQIGTQVRVEPEGHAA